jgi:hypothetical protein
MNDTIRRVSKASLLVVIMTTLIGCKSDGGESSAVGGTPPPTTSNNAPVISGAPANAVVISNAYSFTPSASDPDRDTLSFNVQNKPAWANFNGTTGALTGTPLLGDVGNYSNIGISVSDGNLSDSLPAFSVAVVQNADGSITLSWTAPTQNEDGSALTDLAAYKFYYGTSPGSYSNQVRVDSPGIAIYMIGNLVPATYYVVATAVNDAGVESRFSNEAVKQVL